jgi:hypothetical protein
VLCSHLKSGRPLGFCPWRDGKGILWGYVLAVRQDSFDVQPITPLGEPDEIETYRISRITYLDTDLVYAERLHRLARFKPRSRAKRRWLRMSTEIRRRLRVSLRREVPVEVRLRGEDYTKTIWVKAMASGVVDFEDLDDLMRSRGRQTWKLSAVRAACAHDAHAEADEFLLRRARRMGAKTSAKRRRRLT